MISIANRPFGTTIVGPAPQPSPQSESTRFAGQLQALSQASAPPSAQGITASAVVVGPSGSQDIMGTQVAADASRASPAVRNFIEWQGEQPNPFGPGTIADVWAKQGITDPMNNPTLISRAEAQLARAERRSAFNPSFVAAWQGDWKSRMAQAKAVDAQRQTVLAAADALNKVTVGGGLVRALG